MSETPETSPSEARVSKAEYEALATFRYLVRQFLHFSEQAATALGLTPQQHQALLAIQGFPGREMITISELAERLKIRHHSAVGLVDRLVDQQLVTRSPAPQDQRKVYVQLTSNGLSMLEQLGGPHRDELRRIEPQFRRLFMSFAPFSEQADLAAEE